jgi:hypothetical protein
MGGVGKELIEVGDGLPEGFLGPSIQPEDEVPEDLENDFHGAFSASFVQERSFNPSPLCTLEGL